MNNFNNSTILATLLSGNLGNVPKNPDAMSNDHLPSSLDEGGAESTDLFDKDLAEPQPFSESAVQVDDIADNGPLFPNQGLIMFEGQPWTLVHDQTADECAQIVLTRREVSKATSVDEFGKRTAEADKNLVESVAEHASVEAPSAVLVAAPMNSAPTYPKATKPATGSVLPQHALETYRSKDQAEIEQRTRAMRLVDRLAKQRGKKPGSKIFREAGRLAHDEAVTLGIDVGEEPFSEKKIRNLYNDRWIPGGKNPRALAPRHDAKGNRIPQLPPRVKKHIIDAIRKHYLTTECETVDAAHLIIKGLVIRDIAAGNLPSGTKPPSYETVRQTINKSITACELLHKRRGPDAAQTLRITKPGLVADRPLQIVYVDHTRLDAFVLVKVEGHWVSVRPWLTVAIDLYTRGVWSVVLSLSAPSTKTLSTLLRVGVLPKNAKAWGAATPWLIHGLPEVIITDHGREFESEYWKTTSARLGFEHRLCPEGMPHLKAPMERFFGYVATSFCGGLPGRSFASIKDRGEYCAAKYATFTKPELERQFMRWIIDIAQNKARVALNKRTPHQVWVEATESDFVPQLPPDGDDFLIAIGQMERRVITNKGVRFSNYFYTSDYAQRLFSQYGAHVEYEIRYEPSDLSVIYLLDPDLRRWIPLKSVTAGAPDLDFLDWKKTITIDSDTGEAIDVAAVARLEIAEERLKAKAERKAGKRPCVSENRKTKTLPQSLPPKVKAPSSAAQSNARKPVQPQQAARGKNAIKY